MNDLLQNINKHKEKNDISVCYHLYNYILARNIDSEDDLKKAEDAMFLTDDIRTRNELKYYSYAIDPTHLEKLDMNEIAKLVKYDDLYSNASKEQDKTKYLILMYEIMGWELYFPYSAYRLIIADLMH